MKAKSIFLLALMTVSSVGLFAQGGLKIGYTNADYVLSLLPEAKSVDAELKAFEKQLQNQIQAKYSNYQTLMAEVQQNYESYDELIKADKQQELANLEKNIQEFSQAAETRLVNKRNELLKPLYEKIGNAIEAVAVESGYSHIFSAGAPGFDVLLYAREEDDVSDLILKKLGITPPAKEGE